MAALDFLSIPEIMENQDDLASWVESHDFLYNRANKGYTDTKKHIAVYDWKADEIRGVTQDLCGKLSFF